jgi:hypothetical protein
LTFSLVVVKDCLPPPSDQVGWWPGDGDATDLITGSAGQEIAVVRKGSDGLIYLNGQLDTKTEESVDKVDIWFGSNLIGQTDKIHQGSLVSEELDQWGISS